MTRRFWNNRLLIVLALAFVIRLAAAFYLGNEVSGLSGAHDEISYSMLGQRFAAGHGLTFPEPWYPWIDADAPQSYYSATMSLYLGVIYTIFGYHPLIARLIGAALGTAIVGMIYVLARRLFDVRTAFLASVIAAGYAYLIFYSVTLVTETPFILCLLIAIYLTYLIVEAPSTWRWVALGGALAVTVLFRMAIIFYVPVLLGWIIVHQRQQWTKILIPIGIIGLAVLPFAVRNYLLWGEFLLLESQFGHVFWNGNHPGHLGNFHPFKVFPIPDEVLSSGNDVIITDQLLHRGIANILNDPGMFVWLTITRLREFFTFWPTTDSTPFANLMRLLSFGILFPFAVAGLALNLKRWQRLLPVLLFVAIHTGIYAVTWTMIRYRIPLDSFFIIFAASTLITFVRVPTSKPAEYTPSLQMGGDRRTVGSQ